MKHPHAEVAAVWFADMNTPIQGRSQKTNNWVDIDPMFVGQFHKTWEYRVKPTPKTIVKYIVNPEAPGESGYGGEMLALLSDSDYVEHHWAWENHGFSIIKLTFEELDGKSRLIKTEQLQ